MANNMTDYLEKKLLDHTLNVASYTFPTLHLALFTADPTETGVLTNEVANAGAYARQALNAKFTAAGSETSANTAEIAFPQASASWGTVTHIGIIDSATHGAGNMIYHGILDASRLVDTGTTFKIPIGDLSLTLA